MPSIFTRILEGEIPAFKIAENEQFFAFLDVFPLVEGHTLVVPKIEVDNLFDLDEETYAGLFVFSKKIAHALSAAIPCRKVGLSVVGLEVPHAHVHLIPIQQVSDMNFAQKKDRASDEQLANTLAKIQAKL